MESPRQPFTTLIVEDDPFIAMDIREVAESLGMQVLGVYHHPDDALAHTETVDLAILDINLSAGISGIDLATKLQAQLGCAHMFVTSYFDPATLEKAGATRPIAYITKPFEERDLVSNLLLARAKVQQPESSPAPNPSPPEHIFLKVSKALVRLNPREVDFLQAYDIYAKVVAGSQKWVASNSLKQLEEVFEPYGFLRIHKSYMVNLARIQMIQEDEIYIDQHRLPVGRSYKARLLEAIRVV